MRRLIIAIAVLGILFAPAAAKAEITKSDDFSSTSINTGVWTSPAGAYNGATWIQNGGSTGVLNFTSNDSGEANGQYISNFNFSLNYDFYAKAQFNYDKTKVGGVGLGFYSLDKVGYNSKYLGSIEALYGSDSPSIPLGKYFVGSVELFDPIADDPYHYESIFEAISPRTIDSGWFGMYYNSSLDKLQMGAFSSDPSLTPAPVPIWGTEFPVSPAPGLKALLTSDYVGLSLSGWADYVALAQGEATLDNFGAMSTVPEPVSTILFLAGGTILAVRRLRRKK